MQATNNLSVATLKGVGPKITTCLAHLRITTIQDLLFHLPFRYEDRSRVYLISTIKPGDRVLIEGKIISTQITGARRYLRCQLIDDSSRVIHLVFYYFIATHQKKLQALHGRVRCFGEIKWGHAGHLEIVHPEYAAVDSIAKESFLSLTPGLTPVYSTTKGLYQATLRKLMQQALCLLKQTDLLPELIPEMLRKQFQFFSLRDALAWIHCPPIDANIDDLISAKYPAQQRLIFEELLSFQLRLKKSRADVHTKKAIALIPEKIRSKTLLQQLPFQLTHAQQRVIQEMQQDLSTTTPMLRLLQGDVGSGKTITACFAALQAIDAGFQAALMAPTEILAEQHFKNFSQWLSPLNISVNLLLGRQTPAEQKKIKEKIASGETQLVIGTHALFQKEVCFKKLALLIIDEQHRFGVQQRLALMQKGLSDGIFPHQLMMTATPIPRTLRMTAYADLDFSVIDELPPHRKQITTTLLSEKKRDAVIARVRESCLVKKQAYWICPLIAESDVLQCQAAETTLLQLKKQLPDLRIDLVHGRLKSTEKNAAMQAFQAGKTDVLVATTVVEVGVDIPNASLMIIENAERLGLSQLHQLRGRIGRGSEASFCVLLYQAPLSDIAKKRLNILRETQDGFLIAEKDLEIRGPGDVLGVRQSGDMSWCVANLLRDHALLPLVEQVSATLLVSYPEIAMAIIDRWMKREIDYLSV
ncbi:MAG TPA: ATP-dependent DNA helicase RecG [Coxiellaceae bacterium]|nr:ATP-dependent DNA helicase RecG [Coxiellaceae bacterium]